MPSPSFAQILLDWFDRHDRHDLPWQHPRAPYRVWVSEIMLQQTQVATVIPYFARFMERFPDIANLAHGGVFPENIDEVLALPGIGRSTAAAILAQACGQRYAILDGNVKRVLTRLYAIEGWPGQRVVEKRIMASNERVWYNSRQPASMACPHP